MTARTPCEDLTGEGDSIDSLTMKKELEHIDLFN